MINEGGKDKWTYIWNSEEFSSQKAYKVLMGWQPCPPHFSWIWSSFCQAKHKFFFWLLLLDRLNTKNLLGRKKFSSAKLLLCYFGVPAGGNSHSSILELSICSQMLGFYMPRMTSKSFCPGVDCRYEGEIE
jgi:hypothetical protein